MRKHISTNINDDIFGIFVIILFYKIINTFKIYNNYFPNLII
jgi:hypothetical protein